MKEQNRIDRTYAGLTAKTTLFDRTTTNNLCCISQSGIKTTVCYDFSVKSRTFYAILVIILRYLMFNKTKALYPFLFLILSISIFPQTDSLENAGFYFDKNDLKVITDAGDTLLVQSFTAPHWYYYDLNNDTNDEIIVVDSTTCSHGATYSVFIYAADSSFRLLDSINSGVFQPMIEYNEELGSTVLLTGLPSVDSLYLAVQQDSLFLPVQYFQYNGFTLKNVSDDVYSTYLNENIAITAFLEQKDISGSVCGAIQKHRSAIFTVFFYYRKAGEFSLANKFLQQYYPCADIAEVKKLLEKNN